jgi:eukaryotic-like serine/threonine-protein kinase
MLGTVSYMSPEQVKAKDLDARTDLFSFGAVLYEMATGRVPFQGSSPGEICSVILRDEPAPPSQVNPQVSWGLQAVIGALLVETAYRKNSIPRCRSLFSRGMRNFDFRCVSCTRT